MRIACDNIRLVVGKLSKGLSQNLVLLILSEFKRVN